MNDKDTRREVTDSLKKIAKGTFIILVGTFLGTILTFLTRLVVIRNLSQAEYGILSLVIIIISISVSISSLGLTQGVARFIAYHRTQKNSEKVLGTIKSALEIAIVTGSMFCLLIFIGSNFFGHIFNNPQLILPLRIYSFAIPFLLLIDIFISVFRGFSRVDIKVIFEDLFLNISLLIGLFLLLILGFSLLNTVFVYLFAAVFAFIILAIYSWRKYKIFASKHKPFSMKKTLLLFSFPLVLQQFFLKIISWSDVLMIGYFKDARLVGIYDATIPLARYIPIFLIAITFLYIPLATQFFSKNKIDAIKRMYVLLTKWAFVGAFLIFIMFFMFPKLVLTFLYGAKYVDSSGVLMILSLGFMLHVFFGPNAATLIVFGKTKLLLYTTLFCAILNILLNYLLIPAYGIIGAALTSLISLVLLNIILSLYLYFFIKLHPFTKSYLKPIAIAIVLVIILSSIVKLIALPVWVLPICFLILVIIYLFALLITKSFDEEDLIMFLTIEKKLGINLIIIKQLIKKFL